MSYHYLGGISAAPCILFKFFDVFWWTCFYSLFCKFLGLRLFCFVIFIVFEVAVTNFLLSLVTVFSVVVIMKLIGNIMGPVLSSNLF